MVGRQLSDGRIDAAIPLPARTTRVLSIHWPDSARGKAIASRSATFQAVLNRYGELRITIRGSVKASADNLTPALAAI